MRTILTSFAIVTTLVLATAALAQGTGSSGTGQSPTPTGLSQGNGATGAGSGGTTGTAPVGHRQPRVGDVPGEKSVTNIDPEDAALDRAIRGICRGC